MIKKNKKVYDRLMSKVRPILTAHYGETETARLLRDMEPVYQRFLAETPFIGGKENMLAHNLDMAIPFFALYEASGRALSKELITGMLEAAHIQKYRKIGRWLDMNKLDRPWICALAHSALKRAARKINNRKGGDWNNTWGIQVNPERHDHGIAMTLVGCPLADFAKKHGYMDILPILCDADRQVTEAVHGRLIRHNTVAKGADRCDYWIVGDKDVTSK